MRDSSMNAAFQVPAGWRRFIWPALRLCALMALGLPGRATAHDLFASFIQHNIHLAVGARNVDLVLELTFFEEWSVRERADMDADTNGRVTRLEIESYVKKLARQLANQVQLSVAGRKLELVPLYDPEVDLLTRHEVAPNHHRLRLAFFASTPTGLRPEDQWVIEDRLWPEARALATVQAEGSDGCVLTPERTSDPGFPPARPGEARVFKVGCLKPPETKPAKQPSNSAGS